MKELSARLHALIAALGRLDVPSVAHAAMLKAADQMREAVQERLSQPPGGPHDTPWEDHRRVARQHRCVTGRRYRPHRLG